MVAGREAAPPGARAWAVASLLVLAAGGGAAEAAGPGGWWPLGGGGRMGSAGHLLTAAVALALGWGLPGVALAMLSRAGRDIPLFAARAFGLGTGYLVTSTLLHGAAFGQAPPRPVLLVLLALPSVVLLVRPRGASVPAGRTLALLWGAPALVAAALWSSIAAASLNGDGTEVYELARSLDHHALPQWDLERPTAPGRFGVPAINPFPTLAALVHAQMVFLGRGEAASRLPVPVALVFAAILAFGLTARRDAGALLHVTGLAGLTLLWSLYYFGYEPAHGDLAAPAGLELTMTALWLAGLVECTRGSLRFGLAFLALSATVLYSAPILAVVALAAHPERRRLVPAWLGVCGALAVAALAAGWATGSLPDWIRQIHSEYWEDFVRPERRQAALPLLVRALLLTGGLPLLAFARLPSLSPAARSSLVAAAVYAVLVLAASHKNLHYLAPLPFLMAPAGLEAARRWTAAGTAVVVATIALSWPPPRATPTEAAELGRLSWVDGLGYEDACFDGAVVYTAFGLPRGARFAVGKHTFARYALDLGDRETARFRLSRTPREGWITVAGNTTTFSVRDPEVYARWRLRPLVPAVSFLFPGPPRTALTADPTRWPGRITFDGPPGADLLIDGFALESDCTHATTPARLLLPVTGTAVTFHLCATTGPVDVRVNGSVSTQAITPGASTLETASGGRWRQGWNVVELSSAAPFGLATIEVR